MEDDEDYISGDEIILLRPLVPRKRIFPPPPPPPSSPPSPPPPKTTITNRDFSQLKEKKCKCNNCNYLVHPKILSHFSKEDIGYCCRYCRLSNGKRHGNHCLKIRLKKNKRRF